MIIAVYGTSIFILGFILYHSGTRYDTTPVDRQTNLQVRLDECLVFFGRLSHAIHGITCLQQKVVNDVCVLLPLSPK